MDALDEITLKRLYEKSLLLRCDTAKTWHSRNDQNPFGFEVLTSPFLNQTDYWGADAGRNIFETLSEGYTILPIYEGLERCGSQKTFEYFANHTPGYREKVNEVISYLASVKPSLTPIPPFPAPTWDYLWAMDTPEELVTIEACDNCGCSLTLDTDRFLQGSGSLLISPPSNGIEAKIKAEFTPKLDRCVGSNILRIDLYLPTGCNLNQTFVGLYEEPGRWIGGTVDNGIEYHDGWNKVAFCIPDEFKSVVINGAKKIYLVLSFYHLKADNSKIAINTPINIDGIAIQPKLNLNINLLTLI